jgi:hypothetical protein
MAFLQVKKNLGDIHNVCEAQNNLGLLDMAYQCKCNVDIHDGKIKVSSFRINDPSVRSNFVLVAENDLGDVVWKEQIIQPWMTQSPSDILLSSLSNDENFVKTDQVNVSISNYIETFRDTLVSQNLSTSNVSVSNIKVSNRLELVDHLTLTDSPCILTNNGIGSNIQWSKIVQSLSNNDSTSVVSSQAISNLHDMVVNLNNQLPDDNGNFVISNRNLSDIESTVAAVANLGLNESLNTKTITVSNIAFEPDSRPGGIEDTFHLVRTGDELKYTDYRFVHEYTEGNRERPPSSFNVNNLYTFLNTKVNERLITSQVLGEFFGNDNPYTEVFANRLREAGIQEVAFTSNWEDLFNRPTRLSGFSNLDFQDETMFIYAKSNLSDIQNKEQALLNLNVSTVGITGKFEDLILPTTVRNIVSASAILDGIAGVPFFVRNCNLSELSLTDAGQARSNLGILSMGTFDNSNVVIAGGEITVSNNSVTGSFFYTADDISLAETNALGSNIFLKCDSSDGHAKWSHLPEAVVEPDNTRGIVFLTNELHNPSSNTAITSFAISNAFYNNENISNLVPLAAHDKFGIVKTTSEYINPSLDYFMVVDSAGINLMYEDLESSINNTSNILDSRINNTSNQLTTTVNSKLSEVSISNIDSFDFLQLKIVNDGNDQKRLVHLNFPKLPQEFLSSMGTFQKVIPTQIKQGGSYTYSGDIYFEGDSDILEFSAGNTIKFKSKIYTGGNGIDVDGEVIKNTGIVSIDTRIFYLDERSDGNQLQFNGGATGQFLKCTDAGTTYQFADIDLSPFNTTTQGLVPQPPPIDTGETVLLNTGWTTKVYFTQSWLPNMADVIEGGQKNDYFLNGTGMWTEKNDIIDMAHIFGKLQPIDTSSTVFTRIPVDDNLKLGFTALQTEKDKVVSYDGSFFRWTSVIDVLRDAVGFIGDEPNKYLNSEGNFTLPPSSKDFTTTMSLTGNLLEINQTLSDTIPDVPQTTSVNITHQNIEGLYENFVNNTVVINYDGATYYRTEANGNTFAVGGTFTSIKTYITDTDYLLSANGTKQFIDFYMDNFKATEILSDGHSIDTVSEATKLPNVGALSEYNNLNRQPKVDNDEEPFKDDRKFVTPFAVSNYTNKHYIKLNEKLAIDDDYLLNNSALTQSKIVLGGTLSNYVNREMVFDHNQSIDLPFVLNKLVRSGNVINYFEEYRQKESTNNAIDFVNDMKSTTPLAVSNYVNEFYIKGSEKLDSSANVNSTAFTNMLVLGGTLSNYINEQMVFSCNYNLSSDATLDKLVRTQNVRKYVNELRVRTDEMKTGTVVEQDERFITPKAVIDFVDSEFLERFETRITSTNVMDNITNDIYYVTPSAIGAFMGTHYLERDELLDITSVSLLPNADYNKKVITSQTLVGYFDSFRTNNILTTQTNDTNFTTPKAVSEYVEEKFVRKTAVIDSSADNDPYNTLKNSIDTIENSILTVGSLSNLLFNKNIGTPNSGGIIQQDINYFLDDRVMSSLATQNYTNATFVRTEIVVDDFLNDMLSQGVMYVPTVKYTSNMIYEHIYENTSLAFQYNDLFNEFVLIDEIALSNVFESSFKKVNVRDGTDYSFTHTNELDNQIPTVNLMNTIINFEIEDSITNLMDTRLQKVNNIIGDVYDFIQTGYDADDNFIPTVKFMEDRVIENINTILSTGAGLSITDIDANNVTIHQNFKLLIDNVNREGVTADRQFMTIDSTGEVYFKRVDYIAGHDDNATRNEDIYSLTTGQHSETFGSNQFVCGAYNNVDNIYSLIGYDNGGIADQANNVHLVVGSGDSTNRANGLEVHSTGEVYVRSNLILGHNWRLSFDSDSLSIEKYDTNTGSYIQKHIFK